MYQLATLCNCLLESQVFVEAVASCPFAFCPLLIILSFWTAVLIFKPERFSAPVINECSSRVMNELNFRNRIPSSSTSKFYLRRKLTETTWCPYSHQATVAAHIVSLNMNCNPCVPPSPYWLAADALAGCTSFLLKTFPVFQKYQI